MNTVLGAGKSTWQLHPVETLGLLTGEGKHTANEQLPNKLQQDRMNYINVQEMGRDAKKIPLKYNFQLDKNPSWNIII
jgi:hypothetical protein